MIKDEIRKELFRLQDRDYRDFQSKLIPNLDPSTLIGVRTPELRKYAKELAKDPEISLFLRDLPHNWFDENQLHAFLISEIRDFGRCIEEVELFLPYVDNWATCDQMSPRVFKKHRKELLGKIRCWIYSEAPYTVRFGIGMLMQHYLDDAYDPEFPRMVSEIRSGEYYVNMMIAWYFATALAKQYEEALPYIEGCRLDPWTHNKAIQKASESYRLTPERKSYLKSLRISKK